MNRTISQELMHVMTPTPLLLVMPKTSEPEQACQGSRLNAYYVDLMVPMQPKPKPRQYDPRLIYDWIRRKERREYLAYSRGETTEPEERFDRQGDSEPEFSIDKM